MVQPCHALAPPHPRCISLAAEVCAAERIVMDRLLTALGAFAVRFRWPMFVLWLTLLALAAIGATSVADALSSNESSDNVTEANRASALIRAEFQRQDNNDALIVFYSPTLT